MFLLLVLLLSVVVVVLVVVAMKKKAAYKLKSDTLLGDNLWCDNNVVVEQEMEMKDEGVTAEDRDGQQNVDDDQCEEEDPVEDGFNPYEVADRKEHTKNTNTPVPKESSTPVSATDVPAIYAVVDKSKKKAIREAKDGPTDAHSDQCSMLMETHGEITDTGERVVACDGLEDEQYDETVVFRNEPEVDSKPCQPSEGD